MIGLLMIAGGFVLRRKVKGKSKQQKKKRQRHTKWSVKSERVVAYRLVKQIGLHISDVWVGGEQPVGACDTM